VNRDDVVRLDPGSAAVLDQPDRRISYEETIALLTAAAVQRTQALQDLVALQREFRRSLGALPAAAADAASEAGPSDAGPVDEVTERAG
jgi:hypothetical protein